MSELTQHERDELNDRAWNALLGLPKLQMPMEPDDVGQDADEDDDAEDVVESYEDLIRDLLMDRGLTREAAQEQIDQFM